jgi:hypothetical protein
MPVHDWTRVDDGTFHDFHTSWITHLKEALNAGLPKGFYAMAEQHAGRRIGDVLALHASAPSHVMPVPEPTGGGAVAVADAPPKVSRTDTLRPSPRGSARTLTIRHASGNRIVALVEIISPSNKASAEKVREFVRKARSALRARVHVVVLDLLPPGKHDPEGIHGAIREAVDGEGYDLPAEKPLTFVSYAAGQETKAYIEHLAIGDEVPEMPLFLTPHRYVRMPLVPSYAAAYRGMAPLVHDALEGREQPPEGK